MYHDKFQFILVVHPDEIKNTAKLLGDACNKVCFISSFDYDLDDPTKPTMIVRLGFNGKRTLQNVEQWLVSIFGKNIKDKILSIKVLDGDVVERKVPDNYFRDRLRAKYGYFF